jgi:hypothetical protein
MRPTVARRALAICALLLAAAATLASRETATASAWSASRSASAVGLHDDAHIAAAAPARATEWAVGQHRGEHGDELAAVLLAAAVLVVAHARRHAALVGGRGRVAPGRRRAGIRGPPAFA